MVNKKTKTARAIRNEIIGGYSPGAVLTDTLQCIENQNPKIGAFLNVTADRARQQVAELEQRSPEALPLYGVPVGIKDNLCIAGLPTTCGSKILENFVPPYTATVVEKIEAAGGIIVGKMNMDEFAMGSSTENSAFQLTRNPVDPERIPGGSSGGSAAAVAADMVPLTLGSDTGGSIRQPAALCGVVGLKPTYGLVSRYGLIAFASSLDQIGPFAADVRDAALLLQVIAGYDPKDSTSLPDLKLPDYQAACEWGVEGMTIGIPSECFRTGLNPEVEAVVRCGLDQLRSAGAKVKEISLPHTEYAVAVYYLIAPAEASSNLARYDGVQYGYRAKEYSNLIDMYCRTRSEGFGAEVKRRIMLGTYALSSGYYDAYYKKASQVRRLITEDFAAAFDPKRGGCDVIVTPTAPTTAFRIGEKVDDPLQMYLQDIYTISANMAGIPGISVPGGTDSAGLPVGIQLLAPALGEEKLLAAAAALEREQ